MNSAVADVVVGAFMIGVGLWTEQSIFLGHFGLVNVLLDLFGLYWLIRGLHKFYAARATGGDRT